MIKINFYDCLNSVSYPKLRGLFRFLKKHMPMAMTLDVIIKGYARFPIYEVNLYLSENDIDVYEHEDRISIVYGKCSSFNIHGKDISTYKFIYEQGVNAIQIYLHRASMLRVIT
jgi:hypothetical protein